MSKIEKPITWILIPFFLSLPFVGCYFQHLCALENARIEAEQAILDALLLKEQEREALIDARTLRVQVNHDNNPNTNTLAVELSAASSYDNENDVMEYYWKQIAGTDVANIKESRKEPVLNFDAKEGSYEFQLTITDNYGAACVDTVLVKVYPEPNSCPVVIITK